jgi:methionine aminopeptidase
VQTPIVKPKDRNGGFDALRRGGQIVDGTLEALRREIAAGADMARARAFCGARLGKALRKVDVSVNDALHTPGNINAPFATGDMVHVEISASFDGWDVEAARTLHVGGDADGISAALAETARETLRKGLAAIKPGATFGDVTAAMNKHLSARPERCALIGPHLLRRTSNIFRERVDVTEYTEPGTGPLFAPGMFLEVMIAVSRGTPETALAADGSVRTKDGQRIVKAGHSVGIGADGIEIFTMPPRMDGGEGHG